MKVYYGSDDNMKLLKEVDSQQNAFDFIIKDIHENNYQSYYMRYWENSDGTQQIEYGSHTKFYFIKED